MSEQEPGGNVEFIGILDSIYKKLADEERHFLMSMVQKAAQLKMEAEQAQGQLLKTQMFLAVVVKEHGVRTTDDSRAILRLHKDAFGRIKGDLESWEEPNHMVLSYKDEDATKAENGGPLARTLPGSDEHSSN